MYGLDNASGVNVMPKLAPVSSATPLWFTEGGAGLAASYPGQDWFNMIQAELLNVLTAGGVKPEKGKLNQLSEAIGKIVGSGNYATKTELNNGLALKFDKTSVTQTVGTSTTLVMSQDAATKAFLTKGSYGVGAVSSPSLTTYSKDWNQNGFWRGNVNNSVTMTFGISCNHMDGLYTLNIYGRNKNIFFSTRENGEDAVIDGTFHTSANTITDRNGYLRSSSSTVEMQSVPIGSSLIWNSTAPIPENFWPNEGRSFSAAEYPELAKIFPTLKLPDDRGYAIRIADNGKGIDAGRTVGTYQDCAIENIVGEFKAAIPGSASGVFSYKSEGTRAEGGSPVGGSWKFDASTVVRTANETRMKNVSKILITRVK